MYLVSEVDFKKLHPTGTTTTATAATVPLDVAVITNSMKAISKRKKREAISSTVPTIKRARYNITNRGGVGSMTDKQVAKRIPQGRVTPPPAPSVPATPRQRRLSVDQQQFATPKMQHFDVG